MGLGSMMTAWQRQTKDFGHDQGNKYTCLILDNRGMGESDKPSMRYTTSEMARDAFEVVNHIGWTAPRSLHIIGISLGGMIIQEMAYQEPERIASLTLLSTAARLINTVGFVQNLRNRINLFIPKPIDIELEVILNRLFSKEWLTAPDEMGGFPTNADRYAAQEVSKRRMTEAFTKKGFVLQAIAAGWHHKSPEQMKEIGDKVGRNRIQVMHGTIDQMITIPHAYMILEDLGGDKSGVTSHIYENRGHVLPLEERKEFARVMEDFVAKTEAL